MDDGSNPTVPNLVGDDSTDAEIAGAQEPLKMDEGGAAPPPGSLDCVSPASPTEDPSTDPEINRDPGLVAGSRDPDVAHSVEGSGGPDDGDGDTPYGAEGTMGSEGG